LSFCPSGVTTVPCSAGMARFSGLIPTNLVDKANCEYRVFRWQFNPLGDANTY
jgi:hypothetical protein